MYAYMIICTSSKVPLEYYREHVGRRPSRRSANSGSLKFFRCTLELLPTTGFRRQDLHNIQNPLCFVSPHYVKKSFISICNLLLTLFQRVKKNKSDLLAVFIPCFFIEYSDRYFFLRRVKQG